MSKILSELTSRDLWAIGPLGLMFGSFTAFGMSLEASRTIAWDSFAFWLSWAANVAIAMAAVLLVWVFVLRISPRFVSEAHGPDNKWVYIVIACMLLLSWGAVWLAAWPGFWNYDTAPYYSFATSGVLDDQQSMLHTILAGGLMKIGFSIFGSWNAGIVLYTGVQLIAEIGAVLASAHVLLKLKVSKVLVIAAGAFVAFNPPIAMLACCSTKDSLFSFGLLLLAMLLLEQFETRGNCSRCRMCGIALLTFFVAAHRSNAVFAMGIVALVLVLITLRKRAYRSCLTFCLAIVLGLALNSAFSAVLTRIATVQHSNPLREAISIPTVEVARVACMSDWDGDYASVGIDRAQLADMYESHIHCTDGLRSLFWPALSKRQIKELLVLWASARIAHPGICVTADLELTEAAWYPLAPMDGYLRADIGWYNYLGASSNGLWSNGIEEPEVKESKLPQLDDYLFSLRSNASFERIGPLYFLFSPAAYVWLMLFCLACCVAKRWLPGVLFCVLMLMVTITSLFGPMVIIRYYFYLYVAAPVFVALPFVAFMKEIGSFSQECDEVIDK